MIEFPNGYRLEGYDKINILLGKNGCGKSTMLRAFDAAKQNSGVFFKYITPERGGALQCDGNVDTSQSQNANWLTGQRRRNQSSNFRQTTVSEFRKLETLVLRKIESHRETREQFNITFETTVEQINSLLDRVKIHRKENGVFGIKIRATGEEQNVDGLSSGESELISLAIEILSFAYICEQENYHNKDNWLLLDEPDVHLHPDLQYRLMHLLVDAIKDVPSKVLISTHSTAILSSLLARDKIRLAFLDSGQTHVQFLQTSETLKNVLPMFGAHPLSNVFNDNPILIVEGEDDERIWQSAVRSSLGAIRVFPCVAGDKQSMDEHENLSNRIISSVYENAKAFSLRDRDDEAYEIDDLENVSRAKLNCYAAENLLLSDDVLQSLGITWAVLVSSLETWIESNPEHPQLDAAISFKEHGWDRRNTKVKDLRNIFMMIAGSNKPWEVAVGQAIANLKTSTVISEYSLRDFLGPKLLNALSLNPPTQI